ncbi:MAG TPA: thioredoxin [Actinomycetota bacterium]|nr:thioredoxin [Actinomycetota bacterium]
MAATEAAPNPNILEVTDETFVREVVEESKRRPVVVDFWAEWCQPCRLIGPVLERLADEHRGEFLLAKLDVDANPQVSTAFRIQSIPAVKAFRDGQVVEEFVGALPEDAIRRFLDGVVPSEADRQAAQASRLEQAGRMAEAEALYRTAFQTDSRNVAAALGLGRCAAARSDFEEARRMLEPVRPDPEAERLLAAIEVSAWAESADGPGPLGDAERAAAEGRFDEALPTLLRLVVAGGEERGPAREAMVKLFAVLGEADPLTAEYRPKLAAALF